MGAQSSQAGAIDTQQILTRTKMKLQKELADLEAGVGGKKPRIKMTSVEEEPPEPSGPGGVASKASLIPDLEDNRECSATTPAPAGPVIDIRPPTSVPALHIPGDADTSPDEARMPVFLVPEWPRTLSALAVHRDIRHRTRCKSLCRNFL